MFPCLGSLLLAPALLLLAGTGSATGRSCSPTDLPRDTVLGRPGANLTLSCLAEEPRNVSVSWQLERGGGGGGGGHRRLLAQGNTLALRRLRHEDSGRYSCSAGGQPLRSLRLLVEDPPETPRVTCYRRSHDKDLLCEWPLREKPSPGTRAMLWVKQRFGAAEATAQRCRHFSRVRKFVCRLKVSPGADDTKPLVVSTCVTNGAGSSAGEDRIITLSSVLKPDPPLNVSVEALEQAPQRLRVTWAYPSSWDPRFYWLRFQLRYRPEPARTFTQVEQVLGTWLEIADAWRGTRHVVQVRAQEEFGHGTWSEWSREAVGTPWTEPSQLTSEVGPSSSQFPTEDDTYGATPPPELFEEEEEDAEGAVVAGSSSPRASPDAFVLAGASLLLGIALLVAIVLRYRQMLQRSRQCGAKPEGEGQQMLAALSPPRSPPLSQTPLLALSTPLAPGALHITNLDYFFSGQ